MLKTLLKTIEQNGLHSPRQLAQELGVSEAMVESMLDTLVKIGYLQQCQPTQCKACSSSSHCSPSSPGRVWSLEKRTNTEK